MPEPTKQDTGVLSLINGILGPVAESVRVHGRLSITDLLSGSAAQRVKAAEMDRQVRIMQMESMQAEAKKGELQQRLLTALGPQAATILGLPPITDSSLLGALPFEQVTNAFGQRAQTNYQNTIRDEDREQDYGIRLKEIGAQGAETRKNIGVQKSAELSADATKRSRDRTEQQQAGNALSKILGDTDLAAAVVQNPTVANTILQAEQKSSGDKAAYASLQRMLPELEKTNPAQAAIVKAQLDGVANIGFGSGTYEGLLADAQDTAFPKASRVENFDLTNSVLTNAQQGIVDSTEILGSLQEMKALASPEFFTTLSTVQAQGEEILQRLSQPERQAFYDQRDQLVAGGSDTLSQILFKRSGASVTATEETRAKSVVPSIGDSYPRFIAKMTALERAQERKRSLYLRVVTEGLSLETLRKEEDKNNRIILGELESIQRGGNENMTLSDLPPQDAWNSMTAEQKVEWSRRQQSGQSPAPIQ